ncbi:MAG: hypothetical protein ABF806_02850 [Bifidobacterium psychraerophilum]|uniref:M23 family metallopeptidase n=1 Tax=Bifidobacterium psychraerophilum TaxID=218140 RepID=UPI0039E7E6AE
MNDLHGKRHRQRFWLNRKAWAAKRSLNAVSACCLVVAAIWTCMFLPFVFHGASRTMPRTPYLRCPDAAVDIARGFTPDPGIPAASPSPPSGPAQDGLPFHTSAVRSPLLQAAGERGCRARLLWPVKHPKMLRAFDPPEQPWLAGHRGVDLGIEMGEQLFAPASGTIAFSGKVAGKDVVTLLCEPWLLSFEPAVSDLAVGSAVERSTGFAVAVGSSDHCGDECLHWGVRDAAGNYRNPESLAGSSRIVLKAA